MAFWLSVLVRTGFIPRMPDHYLVGATALAMLVVPGARRIGWGPLRHRDCCRGLGQAARWLVGAARLGGGTPVAIYGAGAAGCQLLTMLRHAHELRPVLFMDDDAIRGCPRDVS